MAANTPSKFGPKTPQNSNVQMPGNSDGLASILGAALFGNSGLQNPDKLASEGKKQGSLVENIEALVNSKSLWKCLSCFACVERCPRDVKPGKIIDAARQLVVRERGGNYLTADEIPELLDEELPQQLLVSAYRRYKR